jgi:hypothetical protein
MQVLMDAVSGSRPVRVVVVDAVVAGTGALVGDTDCAMAGDGWTGWTVDVVLDGTVLDDSAGRWVLDADVLDVVVLVLGV